MEGYEVTPFFDGNSALECIKDLPSLWILDIMLPDLDGYQLINAIKEFNSSTPVIFISARNEELDRVVGLELGSDDYLSKPFLPRELVIRTNKLMDRLSGNKIVEAAKPINLGAYILDEEQRLIFKGEDEITLTLKELNVLKYLVHNKNKAVPREQILFKIWGDDYFGTDRVVDDTLRRIRKKLTGLEIETIYGFGYKLVIK